MVAMSDVLLALGAEDVAFVEPCTAPIDFDWEDGTYYPSEFCGKPAVDDEDEPRCAEHLTWS